MAKTQYCDECKYKRDLIPLSRSDLLCEKGHRPRFYKPKNLHQVVFGSSWGYKRRCDDFVLGDHVHVIDVGVLNAKG